MEHSVELVTPEMAIDWLDCNTNNRPLNRRRVTNLASAMERGEWELSGDAIRFSETGRLLDGQHRLAAIVESDLPIETLVISGLPDRVFDVIDRGAARTVGNIFAARGEKNYNALASVTRLVFMWRLKGNPFFGGPDVQPTARQLEQTLDDNPDIREAVSQIGCLPWCKKFLTNRIGGFCLFVFGQSEFAESLDDFIDTLENGVASSKWNPAIVLRNRLMEDRIAKVRMDERYKTALIFKAFAKFSMGEETRFLRVRTEGGSAEKDLFVLPKKRKQGSATATGRTGE